MSSSSSRNYTLFDHLLELRNKLLRAVLSILVVFCSLVYFAQDLYQYLALPLLDTMPEGSQMIATDVASPFFAPFKLTIVLSIFVAMPYILFQIWSFVAPGLYRNEKRLIIPLMFGSTVLFYSGIAFAYFLVFPVVFAFFSSVAPEGVTIATDISSYLDFVLKLFFAFGVAFEIPIAIILLCWTGITTPKSLREKRPYVAVGAFVIGMLLTPPDVISQTMLAIPMLLLFEVGIIMASVYYKTDKDDDDENDDIVENNNSTSNTESNHSKIDHNKNQVNKSSNTTDENKLNVDNFNDDIDDDDDDLKDFSDDKKET